MFDAPIKGPVYDQPTDVEDNAGSPIERPVGERWLGTGEDRNDMRTFGRTQVLRRNFKFISMLGFASTLICTWEIILVTLLMPLTNGGTAGLIWSFIVVSIGFVFVYASIAEMASMSATSGGQYHWVSQFSPPRYQKFLSFLVGWLCMTSWETGVASASFLVGTTIQGVVAFNHASYIPKAWHATLLVIAIQLLCIFFNTFFAKRLPVIEGFLVALHFLSCLAVLIVLWSLAPHSSAHEVFTSFYSGSGWSTQGISVLIGMIPLTVSVLGFDCAVHMSEEIHDASRTLPVSLMTSVYLNVIMGLVMAVTISFSLGDLNSVLSSSSGFPFLEILTNATGSVWSTNLVAAIMIVNLTASAMAVVATASRQLWSFSRDNGIPFASAIARVHPSLVVPLNAIILGFFITTIFSLINLGSTAALNAIFSLYTGSILTSYIITIGCVLLKRFQGELPSRRWTLGRWGMAINIVSLLFLLPIYVFSFFPLATPVTSESMNWGSLMYVAILVICTLYYFLRGKDTYIPPVTLMKQP